MFYAVNKFHLKKITIFVLVLVFTLSFIGCGTTENNSSDNTGDTQNTTDISLTGTETNLEPTTPAEQGKKVSLNLYFTDQGNETVLAEKRQVLVKEGAIIKAAVEELLKGPADANLRKAIPEGTKLIGVNLKQGVAILDFSQEFTVTNDVAEIVEKISLVNTLTEIKGVEKVKILIAGKDWIAPSGMPYGEMNKTLLDELGKPIP